MGNLGGVEKLAALFPGDGSDEDSVSDTGEEGVDVSGAKEQGHGSAVGRGRGLGGLRVPEGVFLAGFDLFLLQAGVVGALPGVVATAECGTDLPGIGLDTWAGDGSRQSEFLD